MVFLKKHCKVSLPDFNVQYGAAKILLRLTKRERGLGPSSLALDVQDLDWVWISPSSPRGHIGEQHKWLLVVSDLDGGELVGLPRQLNTL